MLWLLLSAISFQDMELVLDCYGLLFYFLVLEHLFNLLKLNIKTGQFMENI